MSPVRTAVLLATALAGCAGPSAGSTDAGSSAAATASSTGAEPTGPDETISSAGATGSPADLEPATSLLLRGGSIVGLGPRDVRISGPFIVDVGDLAPLPGEVVVDVQGSFLAPAFIDSHVHFAYLAGAAGMARGGVAAAVDLAAPLADFDVEHPPLRLVRAGPMITAVMGYPTQSWGAGGYGLECADAAAAEAAVDTLVDLGAGVIKLPVTAGPQLDDAALAAAAARAHAFGLRVVSHALGDGEALRAAAAGADALAHTPTGPLAPATLDAWAGRAVISTLRAFGGGPAAVQNLADLRARGAIVLYGTDYGNSATAGIDRAELELLAAAGLGPGEILAAGTAAPAAYWGLGELGVLEPGKAASLLVLPADPLQDPLVLAEPTRVLIAGAWQD